jgi:DNA-binding MarR family transcriptional regulator
MATADSSSQTTGAECATSDCVNAVPRLPDDQAAAWVGFLAAHSEITHALDSGLNAEFGLSLSALEVLARVAWAGEGRLRISDLAQGALLSQSRVSRLVDELSGRGLVERVSCPSDSRGVFAQITAEGRELTGHALEWHWEQVRARFFAALSERQVKELGSIWRGMLGRSPGGRDACAA